MEDKKFEPHMMYGNGKAKKAETNAEHLDLKNKGWGHDSPAEYSPYKMRTPFRCWKEYKQVGYKKKSGRTVPNCVPK
tara:strand:+ start:327 stop:557 length:231 start_codon:yes stop_codon:yes gene_type:complete